MLKALARGLLIGGGLVLAACTEGDFALVERGQAVRSVALHGGDLVVAGPAGYCIDPDLSRPDDDFAVLAGCDVLTRGAAVGPVKKAVLMVSASQDRSAETVSLRQLTLLANGVAVTDSFAAEGVGVMQLASGGAELAPGAEPKYWRAATSVNGYLVVMTAVSQPGGAAANRDGARLLINLAHRMTLASPNRLLPVAPALRPTALAARQAAPEEAGPLRRVPVPRLRPQDLARLEIAGL